MTLCTLAEIYDYVICIDGLLNIKFRFRDVVSNFDYLTVDYINWRWATFPKSKIRPERLRAMCLDLEGSTARDFCCDDRRYCLISSDDEIRQFRYITHQDALEAVRRSYKPIISASS